MARGLLFFVLFYVFHLSSPLSFLTHDVNVLECARMVFFDSLETFLYMSFIFSFGVYIVNSYDVSKVCYLILSNLCSMQVLNFILELYLTGLHH